MGCVGASHLHTLNFYDHFRITKGAQVDLAVGKYLNTDKTLIMVHIGKFEGLQKVNGFSNTFLDIFHINRRYTQILVLMYLIGRIIC